MHKATSQFPHRSIVSLVFRGKQTPQRFRAFIEEVNVIAVGKCCLVSLDFNDEHFVTVRVVLVYLLFLYYIQHKNSILQ